MTTTNDPNSIELNQSSQLVKIAQQHSAILFKEILPFLIPTDTLNVHSTCKALHQIIEIHPEMNDNLWKDYIEKRWKLNTNSNRLVSNMKDNYLTFHKMQRLPNGKFTRSQNIIFGSGQIPGINAWYLLGHTADAKLKRNRIVNTERVKNTSSTTDSNKTTTAGGNIVDVRVCIENIFHDRVVFRMNTKHSGVQVIALPDEGDSNNNSDDNHSTATLPVQSMSVAALNGEDINNQENVHNITKIDQDTMEVILHPCDFVLISCKVVCPSTIADEPDFLSMLDTIKVTLHVPNHDHTSDSIQLMLQPKDDSFIAKQYITLPNGVTLLRDKATTGI